MDFITAATIAKEQNMYLTTDTWYKAAATAAQKLPGHTVCMIAFRYQDGKWKMGAKELPISYKRRYTWRVYARETLIYNGISCR